MSKIKIVGNVEVEKSFYGQLVLGEGVSSSLDEQLAKAATKAGILYIPGLELISMHMFHIIHVSVYKLY